MDTIVFHARKSKEDKTPKFTIRFGHEKQLGEESSNLLCGVSKPHPRLEAYSKKTGNELTEKRLIKMAEDLETSKTVAIKNKKELARILPNGTASIVHFYADRARRYFQIENPKLIIRGHEIEWVRTDFGARADKKAVIAVTTIDNITPKEV